jgi:hypothetical protein
MRYLILAEGGDTYTLNGDIVHNIQVIDSVTTDGYTQTPQEAFNKWIEENENGIYINDFEEYTVVAVSDLATSVYGTPVDVPHPECAKEHEWDNVEGTTDETSSVKEDKIYKCINCGEICNDNV